MKELIDYAKSFIGVPYIYGGQNPAFGVDCSELVQEILRSIGLDPKGDQTAQMLYDYFQLNGHVTDSPKPGALLFYGQSAEKITHIAFAISDNQLIEAGGGDSTTTSLEAASHKAAFVRIRPVTHRKDLIAILYPIYPDFVNQLEMPIG